MEKRNKNFVGGKLKLKVKKKKINKKTTDHSEEKRQADMGIEKEIKQKEEKEKNIQGTGRIIAIKNTVQGFETKFKEEIKIGYEIIINNPTNLQIERRTVAAILSNKTLLVDEDFSTDIHTTCSFLINPIEPENIETTEKDKDKDKESIEYAKVIQPKEKEAVIKIRKKVGMWSYKTIDKKVKGKLTNEQKLDERVKMGRDKFCW